MKKTLILYVDDEFLNLKLFEVNFDGKYHVLTAENGFEGLKLLENFPDIRIVVSDMKMSGMNGIEFTRKAREQHPDISYFIVTGYEINDEIKNAINSGLIVKCFCKPLNWREISSDLEQALTEKQV